MQSSRQTMIRQPETNLDPDHAQVGDVLPNEAFPIPKGRKRDSGWFDRIEQGGRVFQREPDGYRRVQ
jgi:hypothetical protein